MPQRRAIHTKGSATDGGVGSQGAVHLAPGSLSAPRLSPGPARPPRGPRPSSHDTRGRHGGGEQAAAERDIDGMLPLDWALRNPHPKGARDAAVMLVTVYPDAVCPEPLSPGGRGLESCWSDLVRVLSRPDPRLARYSTIASLSAPAMRVLLDGHSAHDRGSYYSHLHLAARQPRCPTPPRTCQSCARSPPRQRVSSLRLAPRPRLVSPVSRPRPPPRCQPFPMEAVECAGSRDLSYRPGCRRRSRASPVGPPAVTPLSPAGAQPAPPASRLRGFGAPRLRGFGASRLRGFGALGPAGFEARERGPGPRSDTRAGLRF